MISEPQAWALIGFGAVLIGLTVAILRVRSLFGLGALLAALFLVVALSMLALDAPDLALLQAVIGMGVVAPLYLGAVSLTAKTAAPRKPAWLLLAPLAALGGLLAWAAADLPQIGAQSLTAGAGVGVVYVNRALGESGVASAVMAVGANYRAVDTIIAVSALFVAALGAYALLGFGERSSLRRRADGEGER